MATVTVQKWGNSLGIRIPKEVADWIGIDQGSELELHVSGRESITLKPKRPRKNTHWKSYWHKLPPKIDTKRLISKPKGVNTCNARSFAKERRFNSTPKEVSLFKCVKGKHNGKGEMNFGWR